MAERSVVMTQPAHLGVDIKGVYGPGGDSLEPVSPSQPNIIEALTMRPGDPRVPYIIHTSARNYSYQYDI